MADRYWVGGSGSWSNTAKWSTTSGGAGGASVPTLADNVIINSASGSSGMIITITSGAVCNDFTQTAIGYGWTLTGTGNWSIYGSMAFDGANCTVSTSGTLTFAATTTGKTLNSASAFRWPSGNAVVFDGSGGAWTMTSDFNYDSSVTITITRGTFSSGGYAIVCGTFQNAVGNMTINLGSSTVNVKNTLNFVNTIFTFNAGTSSINMTGPAGFAPSIFNGTGKTFYNVTFSNSSSSFYARTISGANTFNNLTFNAGFTGSIRLIPIRITDNITVTGTFSVVGGSGTRTDRSNFSSATAGSSVTITAAAASLADADFVDITIAGAAAPASGTSLGNCGNNSGITFTTPKTVYWSSTSADWSEGWAATSGGLRSENNFPLAQDTGIFNNAGTATSVGFSLPWNICNVDASACTQSVVFSISSGIPPLFRGNWTSGSSFVFSGAFTFSIANRAVKTFNFVNGTTTGIDLNCPSGGLTLAGPVTLTDVSNPSFNFINGTLNLGGYTLTTYSFATVGTSSKTITFGGGGVALTGSSASILLLSSTAGETPPTITDAGVFNSTSTTSSGTRTFAAGNGTNPFTEANAPSVSVSAGSGSVSLFGSSSYRWKNLNFTGFTGSLTTTTQSSTVYGSVTLGSGMTLSGYTGSMGLSATSGTQVITSNGRTFSCPIIVVGIGGTTQLADAFLSSTSVTLTAGTLNTNGYSVTSLTFGSLGSNTRVLTLGSSTWTVTGSGGSAWNISGSNLTVNRGTSTISMTSASSKTFNSNGLTWGALNQGGAGGLIISGNGTYANLTNTVQPAQIGFPVGTHYFESFSISGTPGNLFGIYGTAGLFTLSKVGGGIVSCDYLSIQNSNATGAGAAWYAGANSTNVAGNSGWIFTAAPTGGGMLFFFS
jgi:hypothetical protein